ncbi:MAG TPA: hypothetical protein EYQ50_14225 [Verrucomicrobiales bacterium]|nr:hypothetical protein [Verrucomicrobiales bacterium]
MSKLLMKMEKIYRRRIFPSDTIMYLFWGCLVLVLLVNLGLFLFNNFLLFNLAGMYVHQQNQSGTIIIPLGPRLLNLVAMGLLGVILFSFSSLHFNLKFRLFLARIGRDREKLSLESSEPIRFRSSLFYHWSINHMNQMIQCLLSKVRLSQGQLSEARGILENWLKTPTDDSKLVGQVLSFKPVSAPDQISKADPLQDRNEKRHLTFGCIALVFLIGFIWFWLHLPDWLVAGNSGISLGFDPKVIFMMSLMVVLYCILIVVFSFLLFKHRLTVALKKIDGTCKEVAEGDYEIVLPPRIPFPIPRSLLMPSMILSRNSPADFPSIRNAWRAFKTHLIPLISLPKDKVEQALKLIVSTR